MIIINFNIVNVEISALFALPAHVCVQSVTLCSTTHISTQELSLLFKIQGKYELQIALLTKIWRE